MVDELLLDFIAETRENLASVDVQLVRLESVPDDAAVLADIFRLVHTIKGSSGFVGLPRLGNVAHAAENILGSVRDGQLIATPQLVSAILRTLDRIRMIVSGLEQHGIEPAGPDDDILALLADISGVPATAASVVAEPIVQSELATPEMAPFVSVHQTVRVPVRVLDQLMDLVSELVLTRNQLVQMVGGMENSPFEGPVQRLSQCTSQLQEGLMRTRLQPIAQAWSQLPRIVRDLSFDLGKRVSLQLSGEDTGLDRQVMEMIKDPLIHMVRNAVDHGIETPAQRLAAGKPEVGRVTLHAAQEGGFIFIRMRDDGRGLQLDKLKAKAVAAGVISEADSAAMSPAQAQKLIFQPGLSTTDVTTTVSGRGVGMDVVKANIERIGGSIDIDTTPGRGSEFTIKIPLTLAIISALLVRVGTQRFAFPQSAALELIRVGHDSDYQIARVQTAQTLTWRDELVTLADLQETLELPARTAKQQDQIVILSKLGDRTIGILVDEVFDTQEIVVKPLAAIANRCGLCSGATILGDGQVIVILSPEGIADKAGLGSAQLHTDITPGAIVAGPTAEQTQMLLIRGSGTTLSAVPLEAVTRIDEIALSRIEFANGEPVLQIGTQLITLLPIDSGTSLTGSGSLPVIQFSYGGISFGIVAQEIIDVVSEPLDMQPVVIGSGVIGTAVLQGRVTNIIDLAWYFTRAVKPAQANMIARAPENAAKPTLLVIDESPFFRTLMRPLLQSAGYDVMSVASLAEARKLSAASPAFDIILSDIDGLDAAGMADLAALANTATPSKLVALSLDEIGLARLTPHRAHFDDWAMKMDSVAILDTLTRQLRAGGRRA